MSITKDQPSQDSSEARIERMQEYLDRKFKEDVDRENREWIRQLAAERMAKTMSATTRPEPKKSK